MTGIVNTERLEETGELLNAGMKAFLSGILTGEELGRFAYAGHAVARQENLKLKGRLVRLDHRRGIADETTPAALTVPK